MNDPPIVCPLTGDVECDLNTCHIAVQVEPGYRACGIRQLAITVDALHEDLTELNRIAEELAEELAETSNGGQGFCFVFGVDVHGE